MEFKVITLFFVLTCVLTNSSSKIVQRPQRFQPITETRFKPSLDEEIRQKQAHDCTGVVPANIVAEIQSHQDIANRIMDFIINGTFRGKTYQELHDLVDKHPVRMSGFQNLEDSIDYTLDLMEHKFNLDNGN